MTALPELIRIHFESPGLHTSIQDLGRPGLQSSGIPLGGVMDRSAAMSANHLVDNPVDAPVLEITLLGPKIHFQAPCQIAICGADLAPKLNGQAIKNNETINVEQGSILRFMRPLKGCRAYLAIGGKWLVQQWLGSTSLATVHWQQLTPQSKVEKNSMLEIVPKPFVGKRRLNHDPLAAISQVTPIKVLPGPEFDGFERAIIAQFFSTTFKITPASNRMGYRLKNTKGETPEENSRNRRYF